MGMGMGMGTGMGNGMGMGTGFVARARGNALWQGLVAGPCGKGALWQEFVAVPCGRALWQGLRQRGFVAGA